MADYESYLREIVNAHDLVGFDDVFWNLGQVLAWVETRSPFAVDALSDSSPELSGREHSFPSGLPHFASEIAASNAKENGHAPLPSPFRSLDEVRRVVLRSLQLGTLKASGQRRGSTAREQITTLDWADLVISDNVYGEMSVHRHPAFPIEWHDVRVLRDEVLSAFPPPPSRSSQRPNARVTPVPEGYYALEKAVLLIAKELDSDIWQTGKMTTNEIVAYENLGQVNHYKNLGQILDDVVANLRDRTGNLPDDTIAQRLASYEKCQGVVKEALLAGDLKSLLQFETGERVELPSKTWDQDDAIARFDDGFIWVDDAPATAAPGWASILIDKDSFSDWYYSGTGPMADVEAKERDKGGRPPEYDWDAVKEYALDLVKQHGVPGRANRRLPSKSQLAEAILNEWASRGIQLAEPTVRRYVGNWLKEL
ncbi:hypothetical protein [Bradyrhizobium ottawaense]|uniref:hypothetical protein n=1 Tax=Bradyrhizobium ottawaense TaxID=931866 RepID=UPI003833AC87